MVGQGEGSEKVGYGASVVSPSKFNGRLPLVISTSLSQFMKKERTKTWKELYVRGLNNILHLLTMRSVKVVHTVNPEIPKELVTCTTRGRCTQYKTLPICLYK